MSDIGTLPEMLEIPDDVADRTLTALEKAYRFLTEQKHELAKEVGEAFGEFGDAIEDATAIEP